MISPSPSTEPGALTPDTQPGHLPSQPNVGLWSDSDVGLPQGPATAFVTNQSSGSENDMPTIGHIGRYALKYRIGAGGLGTVYAAHDPLLSRLVAIKTLSLELSADERESFNTLFLDEARAAGGLSHPHIVTVFDAGVSDNSAYIAMEMLKGRDLRQLRQEGWRPSPAQAALIVRRVADALAYAHSKGVVHRDIKPANIFMVGRTQPRVLDFGIARVAHRHDIGGVGDIAAGSPYYMAPEQARQQTVDRRADVFSLGVVLYELLADRKPFRGATLSEITNAVLTHEPPLASEVDRKVPLALAEIAARAMLKDPDLRYRSARSFSRDLRHWLDDNPASEGREGWLATALKSRRTWVGASLASLVVASLVLAAVLAPRPKAPRSAAVAPPSTEVAALPPAPLADAPAAPEAVAPPAVASVPEPAPTPDSLGSGVAQTGAVAAAGQTVAASRPATKTAAPASSRPSPRTSAAAAVPAGRVTAATPTAKKPPQPALKTAAAATKPAPPRAVTVAAAPVPLKYLGTLKIAVSPWGQVEVNGVAAGIAPPMNEMTLPEGRHQIVIRNGDFPPFRSTVTVTPGQAVALKHRF